ncbi:DUF4231 domain-containing protein [Bifidobacterium sp. ESL0775]|uniref:DUF4231 domain-containing protein n=1 Tax=Bifidobacterium sp. ESL0775 TaxID=2983230 RepID=UPI0023F9BCFD|nr:DUF4231 domain-containing protein [Bifidobacterium sp. ESL0775]WEV68911.1 DUF4231 domain-containing protein [Bifidobacterium sp. ESL0775]
MSSKVKDDFDIFPPVFHHADEESAKEQKKYHISLGIELVAVIVVPLAEFLKRFSNEFEWFSFIALLFLICAAIYRFVEKPEQKWYVLRAFAESLKTLSWKFVMHAEPFNVDDQGAESLYRERVKKLMDSESNKDVISFLPDPNNHGIIRNSMKDFRNKTDSERQDLYLQKRIDEQESWYQYKARRNQISSSVSFGILIFIISIALALVMKNLFCNINDANLPLEVLITAAVSLITWTESKRFSELAKSYRVTANDIDFVRDGFEQTVKRDGISSTVADAEQAFSREHAEWISRKDL